MKNILVLAFALSLFSPAFGESGDDDDICYALYELSEMIMKARQAGLPMPDIMRSAQNVPGGTMMVRRAYERPRFSTGTHQEREIQNFANDIYAACIANDFD